MIAAQKRHLQRRLALYRSLLADCLNPSAGPRNIDVGSLSARIRATEAQLAGN